MMIALAKAYPKYFGEKKVNNFMGQERRVVVLGEFRKKTLVFFLFLIVLGIEPRASYMLAKCSTTELHPQL
jgi:hypothetical protein